MSEKPSEKEEEHFALQEFSRRRKLEEEKQRCFADDQRKKEKDLHYMKCPKCGMDLIEIDYREIKVDKCSACEGVWLDTGELERVAKLDKGGLDRLFSVFSR
ncbi:MAG: zf-TFIIB domain-containing protein [Deltaproteobacteria bacterium]|nr:zf-TFIIB domain-containing protein [Deltaproteobacteria bacterium]